VLVTWGSLQMVSADTDRRRSAN